MQLCPFLTPCFPVRLCRIAHEALACGFQTREEFACRRCTPHFEVSLTQIFHGTAMMRVEFESFLVMHQGLAVIAQLAGGVPHQGISVIVPGAARYHTCHGVENVLPVCTLKGGEAGSILWIVWGLAWALRVTHDRQSWQGETQKKQREEHAKG